MADRQDKVPGDLPLLSSGWGASKWDFDTGDDFWGKVSQIGQDVGLSEQMDMAMEGKSAPRVWLILHEPGQPEMSTAVALGFARELAIREQAALVLDCDDQSQSLTRWAERVECEGWIDLARYGTSVLTSGVAMPFEGRRGYLLGVGSFAPTDVTAVEIEQVVKRLRRQADDLILVAPADQIGEMWAPAAGIRLLCWNRAQRPAAEIEGLVASFAAAGQPLTGLVGFGLPAAPVVVEEAESPDQSVETEVEVDDTPPADDFEAPADDPVPEPESVPAEDVAETADDDGWSDAPVAAAGEPERRGTSGVFWFLAMAAVVIVGIMSIYWYQYGRVTEDLGTSEMVAGAGPQAPVPVDRSVGELANQDDSSAGAKALVDSMAATDTVVVATVPVGNQVAEVAEQPVDKAALGDAGPVAPRTVAPAETAAEVEQATEPEASAEPRFSMAPYHDKVGSAGWALHLYSFSDTNGAKAELAELNRRGFETEIRVVETLAKGRWWRVYVGSFATKAEARTAATLLKKKLRTDWANPTRF